MLLTDVRPGDQLEVTIGKSLRAMVVDQVGADGVVHGPEIDLTTREVLTRPGFKNKPMTIWAQPHQVVGLLASEPTG